MKRWLPRLVGDVGRSAVITRTYVGVVCLAAVGMLGLGYVQAGLPYFPLSRRLSPAFRTSFARTTSLPLSV